MSKRYHPGRRRVALVLLALAAVAGALWTVRAPLGELVRTHVALLLSGRRGRFATADARAAWAAVHPDELRVAFVGAWTADARRGVFEKAVSAVNAAGGTAGRRIVPTWIDVGTSLDGLPDALTHLACDPAHFAVFAALPADALISVKPLLLQGRLLTFAPGVTNLRAANPDEIPYLFLPNPSDADIAAEIAEVIQTESAPGLLVCHRNAEADRGLGEELQKTFEKRAITRFLRFPLAHEIMTPFVRNLVSQAHDYHAIEHIAFLNEGDPTDREAVAWILKTVRGRLVLARPVNGDWTAEERKRFFIPSLLPGDEAAERSVWLLADAVSRAKALHPDAVSDILCHEELKTPTGPFCFTPERFASTNGRVDRSRGNN